MTDRNDLHALADGQLGQEEAAKLRELLAADPALKAEYDSILNFKDFVSQKSLRHTNEEAWRACVIRFDAIDRSRRVETFVGRYAWALCAAVFCVILSGRFAVQGVRGDSVRTADLLPVFSSRNNSVDNSPELNRLAESLFRSTRDANDANHIYMQQHIVGISPNFGRFDRYDLRDNAGSMTLILVPGELHFEDTAPLPGSTSFYGGELNGLNCVTWAVRGKTFLLQGGRSVNDLREIATRVAP